MHFAAYYCCFEIIRHHDVAFCLTGFLLLMTKIPVVVTSRHLLKVSQKTLSQVCTFAVVAFVIYIIPNVFYWLFVQFEVKSKPLSSEDKKMWDWLGSTFPKWPILCRMGRKTLIRSTLCQFVRMYCIYTHTSDVIKTISCRPRPQVSKKDQ